MTKFILSFLLTVSSFAATGSWNGIGFTAWNGVAQTAWNGSSISCASGGGSYPSGLTGLWHLDEASGNRADSVNSTTLTDVNTVGSATGKLSNAASFPQGNSDKELTAANNSNIGGYTDFTVGFWFKMFDTSANHGILGKGAQDSYLEYVFAYNAGTDSIQMAVRDLGVTVINTNATFTATNVWHFAVGGYDSVAGKFFLSIDNQAKEQSASVAANVTTTGTLKIGHGFGNWMEGLVDNVFFYKNKALSAGEISTIYNGGSGLAGP